MTKNILFLLSLLFILPSCADMLDKYSHTAIPPDAVAESDIPAVRMGMYNRVEEAPGTISYIIFDFLGGDVNQKTYAPIDVINSFLKTGSTMSAQWSGYYSALYQVNNTIYVAGRFPDSQEARLALGEAYYFRAWIYLCLVTRFGGVPILRENTQKLVPRSSEEDTWGFINENIDLALGLLGETSSYYYVSLDAALALKARICLYQGRNGEAAEIAEGLITGGKYELDDFEDIFNTYPEPKVNTETIFAFRCDMENSGIKIGNEFYSYDYANKGKGTYSVTEEASNMFESGDLRKSRSVIFEGGYYRLNKYPSGQASPDPVIVSRIAEMYLISAEAQGYPEGMARLNELREARGLGASQAASESAFREAILKERRLELFGENHMYYDYVRTGTAVEKLKIKEFQQRFPIPDDEISISKGTLVQNPGY